MCDNVPACCDTGRKLEASGAKLPLLARLLCGACRRLPIVTGQTRIARLGLARRLLAGIGHEAEAVLRNGLTLPVDPADVNGRQLLLFGSIDPKIVRTCRRLLRPGDVLLDIGANYGVVGLLCCQAVGTEGAVHLFEPQPELCDRIRTAISRNGLANVRLHEAGLMDREGRLEMNRRAGHSGVASFVRENSGTAEETITVPVKNIAEYVPPLVAGRPFGVKLDVEGAEPFLLPWLLKQTGLLFVLFEANHLTDHAGLYASCSSADLALYGIARTLLTVRLERVDDPSQLGGYHDCLAVRLDPAAPRPRRPTPAMLAELLVRHRENDR